MKQIQLTDTPATTSMQPPHYQAPMMRRIFVETARASLGREDANTHCTAHLHDDAAVAVCKFA